MLSESFITSIRAQPKMANTAIAKDIGIYVHSLHPTHTIKSTFKKSSSQPNALAVNSSHIFAAQADKAVVHVYSRDRGNQEALISFPERIHSVVLVNDGLLALGTVEGRVILWETSSGRQASTPTSHLQAVSCLAATSQHLISGSEDSNIHVWSVPSLVSVTSISPHEPIRSLSNHRAAITALAVGHSSSNINICISASKDNTCIVWNYATGDLLRTFLLPSTPLCLALDPCDRAVYIGFEDGTVQLVDLFEASSTTNSLYDSNLQATPIQIPSNPLSGAPANLEAVHCLGLSYDGTKLLSGHGSGKVVQWDTGPRKYAGELADLNAPVTNLAAISPFPTPHHVKAINVAKPRLGEGNHTFTAQFVGSLASTKFEESIQTPGIPSEILESAIMELYTPVVGTSAAEETLRKQNEELWALVNEARELQKQTWTKYRKVESGKVEG